MGPIRGLIPLRKYFPSMVTNLKRQLVYLGAYLEAAWALQECQGVEPLDMIVVHYFGRPTRNHDLYDLHGVACWCFFAYKWLQYHASVWRMRLIVRRTMVP